MNQNTLSSILGRTLSATQAIPNVG